MDKKKLTMVVAALVIIEVLVCVLCFGGAKAPSTKESTQASVVVQPAEEKPTEEVTETAPVETPAEAAETVAAEPEAAPVVEEAAPVVEEAAPVVEEAAPAVEEAAPAVEEAVVVVPEVVVQEEPAPQAPVVGKWLDGTLLYVFGEDNTLTLSIKGVAGQELHQTYSFQDDVLTYEESGKVYTCVFEGDRMILTDESGNVTTLTRVDE